MMIRAIPALFLALCACGPLNEGGLADTIVEQAREITTGGTEDAAPDPVAQAALLASVPRGDAVLVNVIQRLQILPMIRVEGTDAAGSLRTYRSPEGISIAYRDGIVVATRGFEADLIGADIGDLPAMLRAGSGINLREHGYLGGLDQVQTIQVACQIRDAGPERLDDLPTGPATLRLVKEACASDLLVFENSYWLDAAGRIIRSRQVVSPQVGFIQTDWPLGL